LTSHLRTFIPTPAVGVPDEFVSKYCTTAEARAVELEQDVIAELLAHAKNRSTDWPAVPTDTLDEFAVALTGEPEGPMRVALEPSELTDERVVASGIGLVLSTVS
jgi:hypothetical protein